MIQLKTKDIDIFLVAPNERFANDFIVSLEPIVTERDFERVYKGLYNKVGNISNQLISTIERKLVKREIEALGSDKIHWKVWNSVKDQPKIKKALGL